MPPSVPVVAEKLAVVDPVGIVTLGGTESVALLLDKPMLTFTLAALFKDTTQVVVELLPMEDGEQESEDSCAGALAVSVEACEAPLRVAVTSAVWSEPILATVAVNDALIWPAGTVTVPGTVIFELLLASETVDPPAGAALVSVTVQFDVPGALTVAGEQPREPGWTVTANAMVAV